MLRSIQHELDFVHEDTPGSWFGQRAEAKAHFCRFLLDCSTSLMASASRCASRSSMLSGPLRRLLDAIASSSSSSSSSAQHIPSGQA